MKVGIIGILERQAKLAGEFPNLDILYVNNKKQGDGVKYTGALNKCDRILVVTKFISHKATENLDKSKITYINGGVTRIRECLQRLNAMAPIVDKATPPQIDFDAELPNAPDMPALPPQVIQMTAKPGKKKQYDFTALYSAKPGALLTFIRPSDVKAGMWHSRVAAILNYAKRAHGITAEVEHKGTNTHVLVTQKEPASGKKLVKAPKPKEALVKSPEVTKPTLPKPKVTASNDAMQHASTIWKEAYLEHVSKTGAVNNAKDSTNYANSVANEFLVWHASHSA